MMMLIPNSLVDVVHQVKLLYFGTRDKSRLLCAQGLLGFPRCGQEGVPRGLLITELSDCLLDLALNEAWNGK